MGARRDHVPVGAFGLLEPGAASVSPSSGSTQCPRRPCRCVRLPDALRSSPEGAVPMDEPALNLDGVVLSPQKELCGCFTTKSQIMLASDPLHFPSQPSSEMRLSE